LQFFLIIQNHKFSKISNFGFTMLYLRKISTLKRYTHHFYPKTKFILALFRIVHQSSFATIDSLDPSGYVIAFLKSL
jgi:hypothetical protein